MHKKGKDGGAQSDDAGAKSGSNASERCEVEFSEREAAHAPSGEAGAQSPSNAAGGARPDKANPPFQFGLLLLCVEKAGDVFITKGKIWPWKDSQSCTMSANRSKCHFAQASAAPYARIAVIICASQS